MNRYRRDETTLPALSDIEGKPHYDDLIESATDELVSSASTVRDFMEGSFTPELLAAALIASAADAPKACAMLREQFQLENDSAIKEIAERLYHDEIRASWDDQDDHAEDMGEAA